MIFTSPTPQAISIHLHLFASYVYVFRVPYAFLPRLKCDFPQLQGLSFRSQRLTTKAPYLLKEGNSHQLDLKKSTGSSRESFLGDQVTCFLHSEILSVKSIEPKREAWDWWLSWKLAKLPLRISWFSSSNHSLTDKFSKISRTLCTKQGRDISPIQILQKLVEHPSTGMVMRTGRSSSQVAPFNSAEGTSRVRKVCPWFARNQPWLHQGDLKVWSFRVSFRRKSMNKQSFWEKFTPTKSWQPWHFPVVSNFRNPFSNGPQWHHWTERAEAPHDVLRNSTTWRERTHHQVVVPNESL